MIHKEQTNFSLPADFIYESPALEEFTYNKTVVRGLSDGEDGGFGGGDDM